MRPNRLVSKICFGCGVANGLFVVPLLVIGFYGTAALCAGGCLAGYLGSLVWKMPSNV
jgi:hypothetical protein